MHELVVNGRTYRSDADPAKPLLWVLRDELALKGTKYGCGVGVCGACVVLLDGAPNHACMVPLARVGARKVTTIEGIAADHPVVLAWIAEQVPQCGYCQPGQILSAAALLAQHPSPSGRQIDEAMSGVLCRCGTYARIRRAVGAAAEGKGAAVAAVALPALLDDLPADAGTQMNDWLWIDRGGTVTVMVNHSEMGQGALTGLAALAAEELDVSLARMRTVFAPADPRYRNGYWGEQFTGGSSSMRGEWTPLREAAAQTRARLVEAAARRWGVAAAECRTADGEVLHAASGRRLGYGELAEEAARLSVPRRTPLKAREEWRYVGKALARLDIPAMCLGQTRYGIDVARPGMLVAAVARCPVFGGRVQSYDARAARELPGVREVRAVANGVAVVAEDFWSAQRGRDALRVAWRPGRNARLSSAQIERRLVMALGRGGKGTIEAVYRTPYLAHATIEPMNCVAEVRRDGCDVWVGTQHQAETQAVAARVAGVAKSKVRVHTQFLGGGFGRRLEADFVAEAVELAKALHAPVQVVWTRADDLQHDFYRPAHAARLQASLGSDGRPADWRMRIAGPELALEGVHSPYAVPLRQARVEVRSPLPTGAWRSVGASNNAFAIESFVDELAARAGRDPLEYRLALLAKAPRHRAVLERAARGSGWGSALGPGRGRGIALYESFGSIAALVIETRIDARAIRVERAVCAIDCGTAVLPDAVHAQLEGSIAFGLSAALKEEVRVGAGRVRQASFADYPILTLAEMPAVETHIVESDAEPGGVGEPAVPVVAPALANAVFAASGRRLRRLPLRLR
ncbi:MAG TPA: molybdopterin cofactor-binding domain-containing protein [Burkholderiales bacterium]|nr:molybdopterin cofactor-binding domain-containing protein [Burkholderiales bacterium]